MHRRKLLKGTLLGACAASATFGLPAFAAGPPGAEQRFVVVLLRGAMDGLSLLPPIGDRHYGDLRGELAIARPGRSDGALPLDGLFGLHPAMVKLHQAYGRGELLPVHAVASPYRDRSHFDGQDTLENGTAQAGGQRDGWLNRALSALGGGELGIALAPTTPLILRGEAGVPSWAPSRLPEADDETLRRIERLYADDAFLRERFAQALMAQQVVGDDVMGRGRSSQARQLELVDAAAKFLAEPAGARVAVLESGGWDTHANQGGATGQLANRFGDLDEQLERLRTGLGSAWDHTVVAVVTEFGRTAAVNGTRGTDHGTGSAAVLLGGAVAGGRVLADWPGLSRDRLFEGRDLAPTRDLRSLFKGVLADHLGLPMTVLDRDVFPGSRDLAAEPGLLRG